MVRLIDLTTYPVKDVLSLLLVDKTTMRNIVDGQGKPYIAPTDIQPRVAKALEQQSARTRKNAEVFTPSWICCRMNNFLDEEWFGGSCPFGTLEGETWTPSEGKIPFRTPKGWQKYIWSPRLEITCGEAPFLVSRYDAATGNIIPIRQRVGLLDRKLRVVGEYAKTEAEWLKWAKAAFRSVYGYEFQGDSLLIARINLLCTFVDYLAARWNRLATPAELREITNIIVWNLWQMDGLNCSVPFAVQKNTNKKNIPAQIGFDWKLFGEADAPEWILDPLLAQIYNWKARKAKKTIFKHISIPGESTMKFDFVIGNPPYQEMLEGTSDRPVYNYFMDAAYEIADKVELITPARFLSGAGKTPKAWNEKMQKDMHFKVLRHYSDSRSVFRETNIMGGIVITYRDSSKILRTSETHTTSEELSSLLSKVCESTSFTSILSIIHSQNKFMLDVLYSDHPEYSSIVGSDGREKRLTTKIFEQLDVFMESKTSETQIEIFGLIRNARTTRFIERKYIADSQDLATYKVLVPASNGSNRLGTGLTPIIGNPTIGKPFTGYTQSFIGIGIFTESEANAALKYIKSKFARCMLGILKATQHNHKETWKYVPRQDFTPNSDIDWTVSVAEIDQQLYRKYGLSEEEIQFIETNVKEME